MPKYGGLGLRGVFTYVNQDQIVADLGCGPGYYAFALATIVGAKGRGCTVDSDEKAFL